MSIHQLSSVIDDRRSPLDSSIVGNRLIVRGEIDAYTCEQFRVVLIEALHDRFVDVVDLSGITFFDSRGVSCLEQSQIYLQRHVIGSPVMGRVLRILGRLDLVAEIAA